MYGTEIISNKSFYSSMKLLPYFSIPLPERKGAVKIKDNNNKN